MNETASSQNPAPVLVVDNDPVTLEVLTRDLTRAGFRVESSTQGADTIRLAAELRPFAITLDLDMPDMHGWTVLERLKADPDLAVIPVVIISTLDERNKGVARGAVNFLVKPVDRTQLVAILQELQPAVSALPPRREPQTAPIAQPTTENPATENPSTAHILVVEDEPINRVLMARQLAKQGWTIAEAADGRSALEAIARKVPNLILLDLKMPGMNGFDLIAELSASAAYRAIPIVVLTVNELGGAERMCLGDSVRKVFLKGNYARNELLHDLQTILASSVLA